MSYREKLTSASNWRYPTQRAPREKEQFVANLNERLPDKQLQGLVKSLFRPSYGGNRNCAFRTTACLEESVSGWRRLALGRRGPLTLSSRL
jgi:hypothetical protein